MLSIQPSTLRAGDEELTAIYTGPVCHWKQSWSRVPKFKIFICKWSPVNTGNSSIIPVNKLSTLNQILYNTVESTPFVSYQNPMFSKFSSTYLQRTRSLWPTSWLPVRTPQGPCWFVSVVRPSAHRLKDPWVRFPVKGAHTLVAGSILVPVRALAGSNQLIVSHIDISFSLCLSPSLPFTLFLKINRKKYPRVSIK